MTIDPHLAGLLGLDLTDPETIAAAEDADMHASLIETLVQARIASDRSVAEIAHRMDTTVGRVEDFERIGGDPHLTTCFRYARAVGYRVEIKAEPA